MTMTIEDDILEQAGVRYDTFIRWTTPEQDLRERVSLALFEAAASLEGTFVQFGGRTTLDGGDISKDWYGRDAISAVLSEVGEEALTVLREWGCL